MIRPLIVAAALLLAPAAAEAGDARLVTRPYNAEEVVRIAGRAGIQATIAFAEDEHIENVAIGDAATWQVTPNKRANLLFIKPLSPRARTNMTVVTDRHTYLFDLAADPRAEPLYVLRFAYPDEPRRSAGQGQPGMTEDEAQALAGKVEDSTPDPARLNFAWKSKGKPALIPARVYDDGRSTYLAWAPRVPLPAIQIRDAAGVEGPVNFAVRGDMIVVDGVPREIVLRSGEDSATLTNRGPVRTPRTAALAQAGTVEAN